MSDPIKMARGVTPGIAYRTHSPVSNDSDAPNAAPRHIYDALVSKDWGDAVPVVAAVWERFEYAVNEFYADQRQGWSTHMQTYACGAAMSAGLTVARLLEMRVRDVMPDRILAFLDQHSL